jgi:hypothetical protein
VWGDQGDTTGGALGPAIICRAVVGEKVTTRDIAQATSEGGPKLSKEGANVMERLGGDHVLQQMEILTRNNQENITLIKDILLSLQKDVASCLLKLEMGWGNKGKELQMDPGEERQRLKEWASRGEMEDGPTCAVLLPEKHNNTKTNIAKKHYYKQTAWNSNPMALILC